LPKRPPLTYFRARYYDPNLGEFISRDPLGYVDGMSLYRGYFVPGGMDPSGMQESDEPPTPRTSVTIVPSTQSPRVDYKDVQKTSFKRAVWSTGEVTFNIANPGRGGVLIQYVTIDASFSHCPCSINSRDDEKIQNYLQRQVGKYPLYEAWLIHPDGKVYLGPGDKMIARGKGTGGATAFSPSDKFQWSQILNSLLKNTTGSFVITGEVIYYENADLPDHFKPTGNPPTMHLPTSKNPPGFKTKGTKAVSRTVTYSWENCAEYAGVQLHVTGDGGQTDGIFPF